MYIVKQKIKNTVYIYEVNAYWDKNKKQSRQRRVCIGKEDPKTGKIIPSKTKHTPRMCYDYGNYYFLEFIANHIGLTKIIKQSFPDTWSQILTCAFYEISERKPLYLYEHWSESTKTFDNISVSSRQISTLLKTLGQADKDRMDFFSNWANYRMEKEYLAFDVTSISSYSKLIKFLEFGYNRDKENLPQINLVMLLGTKSLLPIFYNALEHELSKKKSLPKGFQSPYLKFLVIRKSKTRLILHRNEDEIKKNLKYKGYVVILSNDLRNINDVLFLYRSKDVIERSFDNIKNELDLKRLRVHSEQTMIGRIFLGFIALILHSWIDKKMKEADLYKKWTQEEVMCELKKLKIVEFNSNKTMLTEISKKQRNLFKAFLIPEPTQTSL